VNNSTKEFLSLYYPSLYPYQKQLLEEILNYKGQFNYLDHMLHVRQNTKRYWQMIDLHKQLLKFNDVLSLTLKLIFYHETNDEGELELLIDEYSQPKRSTRMLMIDDVGDGNIPHIVFNKVIKPKLKSFTDHMNEALEVIKEIT